MEEIEWQYQIRDLDELIPNNINPRRLSKKAAQKLKESVQKFGLCQPIVVERDGSVIGGHQRLNILRSLGYDKAHVAIPSRTLSKREQEELTIRLNKNVGEWDFDMFANQWDPSVLLDSGFTEEELLVDIVPKEKPKTFSINIKFDNEDDLRKVQKELDFILGDFPTASMKVRSK